MQKALKYLVLLSFSMLLSVYSIAQVLPAVSQDRSIYQGILPNGTSYYLVANPTTHNVADFALVQRTGLNDLGQEARTIAREGLTSSCRLGVSPQSFIGALGVAPSEDGFVKVTDNSTVFYFGDVPLAEHMVDSVLLMLMDIVDRGAHKADSDGDFYAPKDQAVIVSGDIDVNQVASKLKMLSYMTPSRSSVERCESIWQDSDAAVYEIIDGSSETISTISAIWAAPRISENHIGTIQSAVYTMFVNELGILAKERLLEEFRKRSIPVADVSFEHKSSLNSSGPENIIVRISLYSDDAAEAVKILASTMSSLDKGTASIDELKIAKSRYLSQFEQGSNGNLTSNSDYVECCTSAFLYGAPLSLQKDIVADMKYRSIEPNAELMYFNNVVSALLDEKHNLTVRYVKSQGDTLIASDLEQMFVEAWRSDLQSAKEVQRIDTLSSPKVASVVKVKSTRKDPMSGGTLWTFDNGFRVVYKRQESGNRMHFAMALNQGYGNIAGLSSGEGAFVSDYLRLSKVAGMSYDDFDNLLVKNGMTFNATVNLSNTILEGSSSEQDFDRMIGALLAFVNERGYDEDSFEYYTSCLGAEFELRRGSRIDRIAAIDRLMCPEYIYSSVKAPGKITEDFPQKVEAFWKHQSMKMNDGVLVMVGNMEETKLKKMLQNYVGNFMTSDKAYPRLNVSYQPVSGSTAYTFKGTENSIDVAISSRLALTAENYMAANIAARVLGQNMVKELCGVGVYHRLVHDCRIYPQERFNVMITLEEADPQGFALDTESAGTADAITKLRTLLDGLSGIRLTDADLTIHKETLKEEIALKLTDPQYWIQAIALRYLDGKDFTTSYSSKIDAITAARVNKILSSLSTTSRVEYIIEK